MKLLALTILALLPSAVSAQSDTLGILELSARFDAEAGRTVADFYHASPVAMLHYEAHSLSSVALRVDLRREQQAALQAVGDSSTEGSFRAGSYLRLDDRSIVWADARYVRGNRRNVCWNSTADYLLLYPYVLADSVGGDLSTEEYAFGGGYARRFGRFDLAIRADYRAGQEYRQVDPRPHNVVSDFTLHFGAGVEFAHYLLGADLAGRLYKQQQSVKFLNPRGANTSELFMTGLGGYFYRYSGMEDRLVDYDGKAFRAGLHLTPLAGSGWYVRLACGDFRTDRLYRQNNHIPVGSLRTRESTVAAGYRAARWSLRAGAGYELREGTEMIADRNGQGRIVDEQLMYRNRLWRADAEATVEWRHDGTCWFVQPCLAWWQTSATYVYPARRMALSQFCGAVRGGVERCGSKWRIKAAAGAGYSVSPDATVSLAGIEEQVAKYLIYTAQRLTEHAWTSEVSVRAERMLNGRTACFADVGWMPRFYRSGLSRHSVNAVFGLIF